LTKRFVILVSLGLIPLTIFMSAPQSSGLIIFLSYNTLIISLFVADVFLTPGKGAVAVYRQADNKLYFKAVNRVELKIKNNWTRKLKIEIKDDLPDWHFEIISRDMLKEVPAGEDSIFSYNVVPKKRGAYTFNNVYVRYDGILGLCKKYVTLNIPEEFKVYPNLRDLSKYRLIMQKHRLLTHGQKRIPLRGHGSEFESLRDYVDGDDYRKINWMATARMNKLIVNQFEAEKNQPVYVLLDTGRSMSYSIRGYKKLDYSINAALILSDIVNQKGDNSGLLVFNTDIAQLVPPGKGEAHRNTLMEALYHVEDSNMVSDYHGAFFHLLNVQKRRSIVFIFTDFETTEEAKELLEAMPIISRRHVPVVVLTVNESLENIAKSSGGTVQSSYNEAMAESLLAERKGIIRSLNQRGVICLETYAENFAIDTVNQYLSLKERFSG